MKNFEALFRQKAFLFTILAVFVAYFLYLFMYSFTRKKYEKSVSLFKLSVGSLSFIVAFLTVVILYQLFSTDKNIPYANHKVFTAFSSYQTFLLISAAACTLFGLVIYGAMMAIRKYNLYKLDRKSFKWVPIFFAVIFAIIALISAAISLYNSGLFNTKPNLFVISLIKGKIWSESSALVFIYGITSLAIFAFIILALRENKKINTYNYVGNVILVLLFSFVLSYLTIEVDIEGFKGEKAVIYVLPAAIAIALFSIKYGAARTLPVALISALAVGSTDSHIVAASTFLLEYAVPFILFSFTGSIIMKIKNKGVGIIISAIYFIIINYAYAFLANLYTNTYLENINQGMKLAALIAGMVTVLQTIFYVLTLFMIITAKQARQHLDNVRDRNLTVDSEFVKIQEQLKLDLISKKK